MTQQDNIQNENNMVGQPFSWIHISDLHFQRGGDWDTKWNIFCTSIKQNDSLRNCSYVFITGDIAHKGEFDDVIKERLMKLQQSFNPANIPLFFWAFGNHDISFTTNNSQSRNDRKKIIEMMILGNSNTHSDPYINFKENINSSFFRPLLMSGFDVAKKLAEDVSINLGVEYDDLKLNGFYSDDNLNICILNTSIIATEDSKAKQLFVATDHLSNNISVFNKQKPTFVLAHHPYNWLNDDNKQNVEGALNQTDIYLCGHEHEATTRKVSQGTGCPLKEIIAGSVSGIWENLSDVSARSNVIFGTYDGKGSINMQYYTYKKSGWIHDTYETDKLLEPIIDDEQVFIKRLYIPEKTTSVTAQTNDYEKKEVPGQQEIKKRHENRNTKLQAIIAEDNTLIDVNFDLNIDQKKKAHFCPSFHSLWKIGNEKANHLLEADLISENNLLFLLGNGGTGKTFALRRLEHNLITKPEEYGTRSVVFVELNRTDKDSENPVMDYIQNNLFYVNESGFNEFRQYWSISKNTEKPLILILDGLNEIPSDMQRKILDEINDLFRTLNVFIIVSSRYADNLNFDIFRTYGTNYWRAELKNLMDYQIKDYLGKDHFDQLSLLPHKRLLSLLRTPLMLALYKQTAPYYTPFEQVNQIVPRSMGIKYYGPIYSESTIIYNFYQSLLEKAVSREENWNESQKFYAAIALNLFTPYIAFKMQREEKFSMSASELDEYVEDACRYYSRFYIEGLKSKSIGYSHFSVDNPKSKYLESLLRIFKVKPQEFDKQTMFDLLTGNLAIFTPTSASRQEQNDEFKLFHQQLRDCLSAIHFINEIEISLNKKGEVGYICDLWNTEDLTASEPLSNHFVVRHIAMLEERNRAGAPNGLSNIDKLWNYLLYCADSNNKITHIKPKNTLKNLIEVYRYLLNDNFSSQSFRGLDLCGINLGHFSFDPPLDKLHDEHLFDGAIFDAETFPLGGHIGAVYSVAAHGSKLVSYSANAILLWDIYTRRSVSALYLNEPVNSENSIPTACFSPTDESIIAFNYGGGIVEMKLEEMKLHEIGSTDRLFDCGNKNVCKLCYSPNGRYLMAFCSNTQVFIWDREKDQKKLIFTKDDLIYSGFGVWGTNITDKFVIKQLQDGIEIIDFTTPENPSIQTVLFADNEIVSNVILTSDGTRVFIITIKKDANREESTLEGWQIGKSKPYLTEQFQGEIVIDMCVSADNKQLLLCLSGARDYVIDTNNGTYLGGANVGGSFPLCCSYISNPPNGYENISFIGTNSGNILGSFVKRGVSYALSYYDGHKPSVNCISLRNDEKYLLAAYDDGLIREWRILNEKGELVAPQLRYTYKEHKGCVNCVVYSESGEYFASCSVDGTIILWDTYTRNPLFIKEKAHDYSINGILFTDDGKLISYGGKGEIKLWNIETKELVSVLPIFHTDGVNDMIYYSSNGCKKAVSCSSDKQVIIWDLSDSVNVRKDRIISHHTDEVKSLALCKKSKTFFSNSRDNSICEWLLDTNEKIVDEIPIRSISVPSTNEDRRDAWTIDCSKEGNRVLLANDNESFHLSGHDNHILEFDFCKSDEPTIDISKVHTGNVLDVIYLFDDEQHAISASSDGDIAILDLSNRKVLHKAHVISDFDEKLGNKYIFDNVHFRPKWIRKFYVGTHSELPTVIPPERLKELAENLKNGIVQNIFEFIKNENDIIPIVDLFFACTKGLSDPEDKKAVGNEKTFFLANVYYLWKEAPDDEQNMFMLAELFVAGLDDENREEQKDYESDLDRLFGMLEEKDANHVAVKKYSEFKNLRGKKFIIQSCYKRLYPICSVAKCPEEQKDFFYFSDSDSDIEKVTDSLIANFKVREATEQEKALIHDLLLYSLYKANSENSLWHVFHESLVKIQKTNPDINEDIKLMRFWEYDEQLRKDVFSLLETAVDFMKGCG